MDDGEGHRKQHGHPAYSPRRTLAAALERQQQQQQQHQHQQQQQQQRSSTRPVPEASRLGPMPAVHGPTSTPIMQAGTGSSFGYYDESSPSTSVPLPPHPLQHYQSEYAPEHQRQPSLPQYGSSMVYGIPQQLAHNPPYDPVLPYQQQRRPAGIDAVPAQFAGVQSFYVPQEPIATSAPALPIQHGPSVAFPSLGFPHHTSAGRPSLVPVYSPTMADLPHGAASQPAAVPPPAPLRPLHHSSHHSHHTRLHRRRSSVRVLPASRLPTIGIRPA